MTSNNKGIQKLTKGIQKLTKPDANFLATLGQSGATFKQGVTLPSGIRMTSEEIDRFTRREGWK